MVHGRGLDCDHVRLASKYMLEREQLEEGMPGPGNAAEVAGGWMFTRRSKIIIRRSGNIHRDRSAPTCKGKAIGKAPIGSQSIKAETTWLPAGPVERDKPDAFVAVSAGIVIGRIFRIHGGLLNGKWYFNFQLARKPFRTSAMNGVVSKRKTAPRRVQRAFAEYLKTPSYLGGGIQTCREASSSTKTPSRPTTR